MKRVAILGAGGMGTALALLFDKARIGVRLWSRDPGNADHLARTRSNDRHLPGIRIPETIAVTSCAAKVAEDVELLVAAIPSSFLRATLAGLAEHVPAEVPCLSVVKGIENGTFERPSQIILETLGDRPVAVLSGPSHAEELARGLPASVVVAGASEGLNRAVQEALSHEAFRVYTNPDAVGVEAGRGAEEHPGDRRGDLRRPGIRRQRQGRAPDAGPGGDHPDGRPPGRTPVHVLRPGRGRRRGHDLLQPIRAEPLGRRADRPRRDASSTILAGMVNVAEGVATTRSVHALARERRVEMPITAEVHQVLFEGKGPRSAVTDLMVRLPKVEWDT